VTAPELPPYAEALGIVLVTDDERGPVLHLDFSERIQGRPGFVHGGALSGLMEMAAIAALRAELARRGEATKLKPVNVQVEFMRGGRNKRTYARGEVTRVGRRVALVNASAWQDDPTKPIALAQMKVLLSAEE
jgi:uncharacterized protein (TIGR00369 family)